MEGKGKSEQGIVIKFHKTIELNTEITEIFITSYDDNIP